jgi:hypothetical protein
MVWSTAWVPGTFDPNCKDSNTVSSSNGAVVIIISPSRLAADCENYVTTLCNIPKISLGHNQPAHLATPSLPPPPDDLSTTESRPRGWKRTNMMPGSDQNRSEIRRTRRDGQDVQVSKYVCLSFVFHLLYSYCNPCRHNGMTRCVLPPPCHIENLFSARQRGATPSSC